MLLLEQNFEESRKCFNESISICDDIPIAYYFIADSSTARVGISQDTTLGSTPSRTLAVKGKFGKKIRRIIEDGMMERTY